ncbi:MAG: fructosamine kinase family protein [Anaerolineales bacterium]
MIPDEVREWLKSLGHGDIVSQHSVGGGCINNGARIETDDGRSFFLKTNSHAPEGMFAREAEGLEVLANANGPRAPKPFLYGEGFILLEDLNPARRAGHYWETLGRKLAALHSKTNDKFGFDHDNYLGSTPQPNPWTGEGYEFFAEDRLKYQARLARDNGLLQKNEVQAIEQLGLRLPELVPTQPAALIHGDLWSGNVIADSDGNPAIIDPAAHYGWPEAEIGMTALFGGFDGKFYAAYIDHHPLEDGWRDRLDIYNLYHLLNHLNLFGVGYYVQVTEVVRRYS